MPGGLSLACIISSGALWNIVIAGLLLSQFKEGIGDPFPPKPKAESNPCDWQGNGLDQDDEFEELGVLSVYLRCNRGRVLWKYPRGAIRIILRAPEQHASSAKEFRGCIRASRQFQGARIHLETQNHKLIPVVGTSTRPNDNDSIRPPEFVRCFNSERGQTVLYVEAVPERNYSYKRFVAEFRYDLQLEQEGKLMHDSEDCQPCDPNDLLNIFCSSDFAVIGTVHTLYENTSFKRTQISVVVKDLLRDTHIQLKEAPLLVPFGKQERNMTGNNLEAKLAHLYRPSKCDTKVGSGQFVFIGRWVLGMPMVHCAPRLSSWKHVRTKALLTDSATCK